VAVASSPDGLVNATDLSWELHIANNRVRAQLLALADLELLLQLPGDSERKKWYRRLDSPFWDSCLEMHARWAK
jgi:hypothetical protein